MVCAKLLPAKLCFIFIKNFSFVSRSVVILTSEKSIQFVLFHRFDGVVEGQSMFSVLSVRDPRKQRLWISSETVDLPIPRFQVISIAILFIKLLFINCPFFISRCININV